MQQGTGSFTPAFSTGTEDRPRLSSVEAGFIHNWAALAGAFGMDPMLGKVHALAFLSDEPLSAAEVADAIGLELEQVELHLHSLERCGAVRAVAGVDRGRRFESDGDPWSWFLETLKERGRREFAPLLQSIREANRRAQQVRSSLHPEARSELHRIQRIARFCDFVEQIAGVVETFASLGAGPVMAALRMVAKMRGPRLART